MAAVHVEGRGGTDLLLRAVARDLAARGFCITGVVQSNPERAARTRCDMDLTVLPDGPTLRISQDRGDGARGCRLDVGALETAVAGVEAILEKGGLDLLLINKFGKREAEGHGFAATIGTALSVGVPVLVGVNQLNRPEFEAFADGLATMLPPHHDAVLAWCLAATGTTTGDERPVFAV
ncbi:DUF2478 domain-containing protein [Afifella marina DSM 2698]|nr:DUF2478 domain-containing protein [Afifella marina DSM 2698]MBK1628424.1 DUF2478 domain-containing protein [Afifella marina]MBK5917911.1 3-dehydroquinate dehydratase [Afifella marina]RAI18772.1 3-dehydroquinate dehydratase [Afifella marina DSM 2698]